MLIKEANVVSFELQAIGKNGKLYATENVRRYLLGPQYRLSIISAVFM